MGLKDLDYSKSNINSAAEYKFSRFHNVVLITDDASNSCYANYDMNGVPSEIIDVKRIIVYEINNELQHYASFYFYGDANEFKRCVRFQPEYFGIAKMTIDYLIAGD